MPSANAPDVFEALPLVLTVEEAARVLRIGRSAAYEQAATYLATSGATGLPVVRFGRSLRVPRHALGRLLGYCPEDPTCPSDQRHGSPPEPQTHDHASGGTLPARHDDPPCGHPARYPVGAT